MNFFLGRWRNSAYSWPSLILWSCNTRGRLVTIPVKFHQISSAQFPGKQLLTNKLVRDRKEWHESIPDPLGKKSFPTTLSKTEDLPELYTKANVITKNTYIRITFFFNLQLAAKINLTVISAPCWSNVHKVNNYLTRMKRDISHGSVSHKKSKFQITLVSRCHKFIKENI